MSRWSLALVIALSVFALLAGACANSDLGEVLAASEDPGAGTAADSGESGASSDASADDDDDAPQTAFSADGSTDSGADAEVDDAEEALDDCAQRPFIDTHLFGDRWCWDDWAYGSVDVLGGDGIGYTAFRAQWTPQRSVAVVGELELGNLIDAGLPIDPARNICAQMAADGVMGADRCDIAPNPASLALVAVQTILDGGDAGAFGTSEAINELTGLVSTVDSGRATLNRRVSYRSGLSADGCWLEGDVTLVCAVDIRSDDQLVVRTLGVSVSPQGVTGPDFEGFTGEWDIAGAIEVDPADDALTLSIYGLSGFELGEDGTTLATLIDRFGGDYESTASSPVEGACFLASGRGFPGLQFIVEGADSGDPLDGMVRGYISLSPDYGTPSGMRPGSQRFDVTDALGLQLERSDGSGLAGYWLDFRAEDAAEQDVTVRFEIGIDDLVSMVAAGERDWVTNPDCGHLE